LKTCGEGYRGALAADPTKRPSFPSILKFLRPRNVLFPGVNMDLVLQHIKDTADDEKYPIQPHKTKLDGAQHVVQKLKVDRRIYSLVLNEATAGAVILRTCPAGGRDRE
jgi:hypothetical protein